jgi:hypothetical protein
LTSDVFFLGVVASVACPHGAATPAVQEDNLVAGTRAIGGLGLTLLLVVHHHVEVLDTVVAHELEELGMMVKLAAQVGQTSQLSI